MRCRSARSSATSRRVQPAGEPEGVVFTADLIDRPTLAAVLKYGVTVNASSLDMLARIGEHAPTTACGCASTRFRPRPQQQDQHRRPAEQARHLDRRRAARVEIVRQYGLKLVGIHMHIGSGVDYGHLSQVCDAMVDLVTSLGHDVDAISAGGGLSIPYRDGEPRVDVGHYFSQWDAARKRIERHLGHRCASRSSRAASSSPKPARSSPKCRPSTAGRSTTSC